MAFLEEKKCFDVQLLIGPIAEVKNISLCQNKIFGWYKNELKLKRY